MKPRRLTPRQEAYVCCVLAQQSPEEIAQHLKLRPAQVERLKNRIEQKLGTPHMVGYIRYALAYRLIATTSTNPS